MLVGSLDHCRKEQKELHILMRLLAGLHEVLTRIGNERPVIMLTGTVNTCKRLFMKQTCKTMSGCDLLHALHHQLVMVGLDINC